jgi:tungstate transport system ATP-binding protein
MTGVLLDIQDLCQSYGGRAVLHIDRLAISEKSIVGLMGPNGSGKSTLLKLLGMIDKPAGGQVTFNGRVLNRFDDQARMQIALLPQEAVLMKRRVFENVAYGLKLRGLHADLTLHVGEALNMVGFSQTEISRRPWYALSGGEAQRVALAARLALRPKVLLLDEPTTGVDAASAQLIREAALRASREWSTTLVVASHDWQWLNEICDDVHQLINGRLLEAEQGTPVWGPWEELPPGRWCRMLTDRQILYVTPPPHANACAIIEPHPLFGSEAQPPAGSHVLRGTVSRLHLARRSGRILVSLLVGSVPFTIAMQSQDVQTCGIFPGQRHSVYYLPQQIRWH